ncbi:caspase, EACC1-associated type [Streptomyces sp. NPDC004646]
MSDLTGPGVRILLLATAEHDGPTLPAVPSVAPTHRALRTALIERCAVPSDRVRCELDPPDARFMAQAVAEEAQRADSVLLVHFVGHGLLDADGELYLAARATDRLTPGLAAHQALSFAALRQALTASRAASVVLLLDCCFSGRPVLGHGGSVPAFSAESTPGLYFIGSAEQLALAAPESKHTVFTGALIDVLNDGDPRGPHPMTLDSVYDAVFRTLRERQLPLPRRQSEGRSGSLVLAPNPAVVPPEGEPKPPVAPAPGRSPYPGLFPFAPDDARLFHGRERMVARLLDALREEDEEVEPRPPGPRILVGASGSGKTSLLNAGLLRGIRDGKLPGPTARTVVRMTPGATPLRRLAERFAVPPDGLGALRTDPERAAADLLDRMPGGPDGSHVVLLVDQLEELFTLSDDDDAPERTAFLRALSALAARAALVVLALRADFYGRAATEPELLSTLRDRAVLVEPMTTAELRSAIEEPAARAGLRLDDGLAELILHEFGAMSGEEPAAGALPLLSHALWETWRKREGTRLTFTGYRATGGISGALAQTADTIYDELDTEGRTVLQHLLTRLVRVGDGDSPDTARSVDRTALVHGLPEKPARRVIERLTAARLLTHEQDTTRLSHEALIRGWPELRGWVDADRAWLRLRQQLTDDATAWNRSGRDPSLLYRGNRLAGLREQLDSAPEGTRDLDPLPAAFEDASTRLERRGVRRRQAAVALLAAFFLLATTGLIGSLVFQRQAEQAHRRDLARYLAAEAENLRTTQPGLAKQLSLLSFQMNKDAGRAALLDSRSAPGLINGGQPATDLAAGADGRTLAISSGDAIVLRTEDGPARITARSAGSVAVSRDGRTLAAVTYPHNGSGPATVRLWDLTHPAKPRPTASLKADGPVGTLAFGADGKVLYGGAGAGRVLRWDLGAQAAPTALPALDARSGTIDSLAASPRRDLLAAMTTDGRITVWKVADATRPERVSTLGGAPYATSAPGTLHRVAFDRTGKLLAGPVTVKTEYGLGLWRLDDPGKPRRVRGGADETYRSGNCISDPTSLAFSPDRDQVVGACDGWHAWAYSADSLDHTVVAGVSVSPPTGFQPTGTILFDPGRSRRLMLSTDHGVLVWYLSNLMQPGADATLPLTPGTGGQMDYRRSGHRQLIAWEGVGVNYLVDVTDLNKRRLLAVTRAPDMFTGEDIALSPDGRLLADVEVYKKGSTEYVGVRLRDTTRPNAPLLSTIGDELHNGVQVIAFSPTEPLLAISDANGYVERNRTPPTVRLFDIKDPRHPRQVGTIPSGSVELAFSPDGRTLLAPDWAVPDKTTGRTAWSRLDSWDVTDPARPTRRWTRRLPAGSSSMDLAFRPDGKLLALYLHDGTLTLWPVTHDRLAATPVATRQIGQSRSPLSFSPDGTRLALISTLISTGDDYTRPEIWDVRDPKNPSRESYLAEDSPGELYSVLFSPDGQRLAAVRGSHTGGVDLWSITPGRLVDDLCHSVGDPISGKQWREYLPGRSYAPPCGTGG